ncbi:MAG: pantetheine-phosphate adenylyltransferase [Gammaproteobacteria bacterium]|jgi:pantetheine-phosphate adenylyltransferase|nr:pantetheine-phosphate adenylyltransferase [Gammaproteobacteria bacterium]
MSKAIYPGTFDPITSGHGHIIERALELFESVVVAVAANPGKAPAFDLEERKAFIESIYTDQPRVRVVGFSGLLVQCARDEGASVIVRGLRAVSDFEFEFQMALMNRHLDPNVETVFLTPSEHFTFTSASLVREIASLGGDVSDFVHPLVLEALRARFG